MDKGAKSQPPRKNVDSPKTPSSRYTRKRNADNIQYSEEFAKPLPEQIVYRYNALMHKHECMEFEFYALIDRVLLNGSIQWLDKVLYSSVERRETPLTELMMLHERYTLHVRPEDIRCDPTEAKRKSYKRTKILNRLNDPADTSNLSCDQLRYVMAVELNDLCRE